MLTLSANTIEVSKLFCDRLSLTIDYVGEQRSILIKNLEDMRKQLKAWPVAGKRYKRAFKFWLPEDPFCSVMVISWAPCSPDLAYLRIEFNPSKMDMNGYFAIMEVLLPGGASDLQKIAKVTRIDLAVDLIGVKPSDLFVYYQKIRAVQAIFKSGSLESLYLGDAQSPRQIVLYDKQLQLKESLYLSHPMEKHVKSNSKISRLEVRVRPDLKIEALKYLTNPFLPLHMKSNSPALCDEQEWSLIHLTSNLCGHHALLSALNKDSKASYLSIYKLLKEGWWSSEKVWSDFGAVVDGLLPPWVVKK